MANYNTLQNAIDADITNMTILRNHSRNDDSTTIYTTGIDWFKFNNVVVNNLYSSGNSWIGFGISNEQLRVNRQDCAVWDEYSETGIIGKCKFFKFKWKGTSFYPSSYEKVDSYQQYYDIFLLDTGQIFFSFYKVPTTNYSGTNQLICGSQTLNYSVTAGVPCEYTFTPADAETGTDWIISTERPETGYFKTSGTAIYTVSNYEVQGHDKLNYTINTPIGTNIIVSTSVNNGNYTVINNGDYIQNLPAIDTLVTLKIKFDLSTTDNTITPEVSYVNVTGDKDKQILVLGITPPNISSVIGNVTINYDGLGGLKGYGGPTSEFTGVFIPSGLTWKGHQNEEEHIELNMSANVDLRKITFYNTVENEHIELNIAATVALIDIHDI